MNKSSMIPIEKGYYIFKLEDLMLKNNTSKNKLMQETNTDYKVLQRIFTGELSRIDITVLARFCDYFDCTLNEIIEYIPNTTLTK